MAFLAHLLQVFTGFIGPLIIFCVKQDSRFVKFHALQSLVWQLCNMSLFVFVMIGFFFSIFSSVAHIPPVRTKGLLRDFSPFPAFLAAHDGWMDRERDSGDCLRNQSQPRGVGRLPHHRPMVPSQRRILSSVCLVTLVTTLRCGIRNASDTIIRLL
jgi:hypothetical protein